MEERSILKKKRGGDHQEAEEMAGMQNILQDTDPKKEISLVERFYNAMMEAFGGDNTNQYFCLTMPGTVVNKEDFVYDVKQGKPTLVADAESKLVNQLYDPCRITNTHNGRHLATQYLTALDVLTSKLNPKIYDMKQMLRDLLNMPYEYITQEGEVIKGTVQQIFYMLYEDWIDAKKDWNQMQLDEKRRLLNLYPEDPKKALNEYDEWYQTVADGYLTRLSGKMGKILAVFSVNDMKLIESILSSGAGAELEDARERVMYARRTSPDGGYVYPVTLNPSDWFNCLDTDFDYVDMLEAPEAYALKLNLAKKKLQSLNRKLGALVGLDQTGKYETAVKNYEDKEAALDKAFGEINYLKDALMVAKSLSGLGIGSELLGATLDTAKKTEQAELKQGDTPNITDELIKQFLAGYQEIDKQNQELTKASNELAKASLEVMNSKAASLQSAMKNLQSQIDETKDEITGLTDKMKQAGNTPKEMQGKLTPDVFSKRFTQVNLTLTVSESLSETQKEAHSKNEKVSVNCLFAGYNGDEKHADSSLDNYQMDKSATVEIGMLAMKVDVERNWFEPGVFLLTRDMYNTSGELVSTAIDTKVSLEEGLAKLRDSNTLFPCFSVGFLLVKDVTIKVSLSETLSQTQKKEISDSSSKSGGCLFFKYNKSEASEDSHEKCKTSFNGKEMCVRIPGAQILGQFMEITPPDMSKKLTDKNLASEDEYSIADFAEKCRQVIESQRKSAAQ